MIGTSACGYLFGARGRAGHFNIAAAARADRLDVPCITLAIATEKRYKDASLSRVRHFHPAVCPAVTQ
ncbi:MAG: hypothetical protein CL858_23495 [Cupriavidus sp.]|jgi:hypothetical protein|nr:hypothetical protein [Cupriavidus pauculus]MBU68370.1 hypothetical protein [Cupriavidus sp.]MBY4729690.1 hypothetical protein [Cupriavidus pauculus]MCM3606907.1 hypothetical protein [Cupriavidus pauculus]